MFAFVLASAIFTGLTALFGLINLVTGLYKHKSSPLFLLADIFLSAAFTAWAIALLFRFTIFAWIP